MTGADGIVPAEKLYGISAELAQTVVDQPFAPTQVGNIKYKTPCGSGAQLAVRAKVVRMHGSKQYIYVQIITKDIEIFRAKFIMNVAGRDKGAMDGKNSG